MGLVALFALGVVALVTSARSSRHQPVAKPVAPMPMPVATAPSPIVMLGDYMLNGTWPPPPVIMCAIAEAEQLGRDDIADAIVKLFILPVIKREQEAARAAQRQKEIDITGTALQLALATQGQIEEPAQPALPVIEHREPAMLPSRPEQKLLAASPIDHVDPIDWSKFCDRLRREDIAYVTAKHVGQYRQRRERLTELGIDPDQLVAQPDEQRKALEADISDVYRQPDTTKLAERYVSKNVTLPGHIKGHTVTLSGLLGVIQAAGLDGASEWLAKPLDRKRYPNTTQAFIRSNGVF